jgi:hypothetical protein
LDLHTKQSQSQSVGSATSDMRDGLAMDFSDVQVEALAERIAHKVVERLRPPVREPATIPGLVSKAELAHALRRSTPTIDRWVKLGMPYHDMGTYRLFDLPACRAWVAQRPRPGRPVKVAPSASPPARSLPAGVELRTRKRGA